MMQEDLHFKSESKAIVRDEQESRELNHGTQKNKNIQELVELVSQPTRTFPQPEPKASPRTHGQAWV